MSPIRLNRRAVPQVQPLEQRVVPAATPLAIQYDSPTLAAMPTDSRFSEQWGLLNSSGKADINVTPAWDLTRGSTAITVSVIDTGIDYMHPDLYRNVWLNQGEIPAAIRSKLIDTDSDGRITFYDLNDTRNQGTGKITDLNANGYIDGGDLLKPLAQGGWSDGVSNNGDTFVDDLIGWNFVSNTNDPFDDHGHGTHVSGTIGATGNNTLGVAGINWVSQLMGLKVFNSKGSGDSRLLAAAVDYATSLGAKVINASWTLGSVNTGLNDAIGRAATRGTLVIAAAGNAAQNIDVNTVFPANSSAPNVITVGAIDAAGNFASYSNFGVKNVDLVAPGSNILSTNPNKSYGFRTGTSMATPQVTGVVALAWARNPSLSYTQIVKQVLSTVTQSANLTAKVATGGIVNAAAALAYAHSSSTTTTSNPTIVSAVSAGPSAATLSSMRVTFDRAMTFSSLTASSCTLVRPDGQVVTAINVKDVAGSQGRSFDIIFNLQTLPGTYTFRIAAVARDTAGRLMTAYSTQVTRGTVTPPVTPAGPKVETAQIFGPTAVTMSSARVTFDRPMLFSSLTAASCTLIRPDGQIVTAINVKEVAGSGGKSFDIIFGLQSLRGTYTLKIAPVAKDLNGVTMVTYTTSFQR